MAFGKGMRVVVVGGSLAGHAAIAELAALNFSGDLVWVTGESSAPYSKPALSKEFMQGKLERSQISLPPPAAGIMTLTVEQGSRCTALDPTVSRVEVERHGWIDFDALFICTGAEAHVPSDLQGIPDVFALRTLEDALAIRSRLKQRPRVAVLGMGLIGSELAASLRSLDLQVTLIGRGVVPMEQVFGPELGQFSLDQHRLHGVDVRAESDVVGIASLCSGKEVILGNGPTVIADLVLLGLGSVPATGWLKGSGLDLSNGIVCDETMATSRSGIYAAGDVACWPNPLFEGLMRVQHWTNASSQARCAVRNFAATSGSDPTGVTVPFADVPYFWSDQYGLKLQMVGSTQGCDRSEVDAPSLRPGPLVRFYRDDRLVAAAGVNAPREIMKLRQVIATDGKQRLATSVGALT